MVVGLLKFKFVLKRGERQHVVWIARMPRSVKDSDDDEPKAATGRRQTRMLVQSAMNSPLRRSSRIKQNKNSPGSESDSSISSNQTNRSTRTQTATMDTTVLDTMKKSRTRKYSISSEISEIDVEVPPTPGKRVTRQSLGAGSLLVGADTPTKINTRAASKRLVRATSETQSPAKTTRKTRASSIEPESLSDRSKRQSDSPNKTRRRASMLPSSSLIKRQIELEDRIPYVRLNTTIIEADEITSSGNSDSSPDKALQISQKMNINRQSIDKNEVEDDYNHEKVDASIDSSKSETLQQSEKKAESQAEDMGKVTDKIIENTLDKGQHRFEKTPSSNNNTVEECSSNSSSFLNRRDSAENKIVKESLSDIEKSLVYLCESTKESDAGMPENLSNTSIEEQGKSNKENQILNIINDESVEKCMQSKIALSSIKSLTSPFVKKLSEKESKSTKKENLNKCHRSKESTEIAIKHSDLSEETADNSCEKMDISIESSNSSATDKTVLLDDSIELVDKIINTNETSIENTISFNENATKVINKPDKIIKKECTVIDNENSNKTESNEAEKISPSSASPAKSTRISDSRESFSFILSTDDNEIRLTLEEQSPHRDENEVSSAAHSKSDLLQISSSVNETTNDLATVMDKQSGLTQNKVIDTFNSEHDQERESLSTYVTEPAPESSNTILEINKSARDNSNVAVIQDNQSSDVIKESEKSTMDISPVKTDAKDVLSEKIMKQNLKRKSTDASDILEEEKESSQMETSKKNQENMEITNDIAGIDLFQDIPADKWKENNDVKTDSVQSISQSVAEVENECDLILVDKQAWLAAKTIEAAKDAESFEYDSDDTVLLMSRRERLDALQANYDTEKLATVDEELSTNIDSEEKESRLKKRKSKTKRRLSKIDQDSSRCTEDEDNFVDKSLNKSKTDRKLTSNRSSLNKSCNKDADNKTEDEDK
ncbi:PREDICTED: centriolin-like, partial [Wasmannia auropunctata]|uniref:centriolin-like n=1 Tax=Wasmannia auropunctata TaxID=64793 RepID=UPI0005EF5BCC